MLIIFLIPYAKLYKISLVYSIGAPLGYYKFALCICLLFALCFSNSFFFFFLLVKTVYYCNFWRYLVFLLLHLERYYWNLGKDAYPTMHRAILPEKELCHKVPLMLILGNLNLNHCLSFIRYLKVFHEMSINS